ncbi:hypothetical protein MPH_11351 [Macrophomina phaseolina MS6]|uniref:Uncharacterized protein n=1 Tax=Macrophomina phaseolina (strain MS6) TaxID=1126212 RepID=K2S540_MACPH|nr:hypothetical protein MPH_11351 [Macrophomina phaseolina MS6]
MNRLTFASMTASMRTVCTPTAAAPMHETTASCPRMAVLRDSFEFRFALTTETRAGNMDLESLRVIAVTLKSLLRRASTTAVPTEPEASEGVSFRPLMGGACMPGTGCDVHRLRQPFEAIPRTSPDVLIPVLS